MRVSEKGRFCLHLFTNHDFLFRICLEGHFSFFGTFYYGEARGSVLFTFIYKYPQDLT